MGNYTQRLQNEIDHLRHLQYKNEKDFPQRIIED